MKKFLTILLLFFYAHGFAQDDSLLQMLIDSIKTENSAPKTPAAKDTQRAAPKTTVKKDSVYLSISPADSLFKSRSSVIRVVTNDSLKTDTIIAVAPTAINKKPLNWKDDTAFQNLLLSSFMHVKTNLKIQGDADLHKPNENDYLFYALVMIILLLAIIRQLFPKYFQNLFRFLFEASFRQKQRREQLMQETLPSLLMNILFILVCGLFIAIMAHKNHWFTGSFWQITFYSITILALTYIFKYAVIQISGWIFNAEEPASTYSFIVFLVNKIIGLLLLPLLLLFAFSENETENVTVTVAACLVIFMLLFRYIISLTIIRSTLSIHPLHFFIYLCAVELMPMLIIFKLLFRFIGKGN